MKNKNIKKVRFTFLLAFVGGFLLSFLPFLPNLDSQNSTPQVKASVTWTPETFGILGVKKQDYSNDFGYSNTIPSVSPLIQGVNLNDKIQIRAYLKNASGTTFTNTQIKIGGFSLKPNSTDEWVTNSFNYSTPLNITANITTDPGGSISDSIALKAATSDHLRLYFKKGLCDNYLNAMNPYSMDETLFMTPAINAPAPAHHCFMEAVEENIFTTGVTISASNEADIECPTTPQCSFNGKFISTNSPFTSSKNNLHLIAKAICAEGFYGTTICYPGPKYSSSYCDDQVNTVAYYETNQNDIKCVAKNSLNIHGAISGQDLEGNTHYSDDFVVKANGTIIGNGGGPDGNIDFSSYQNSISNDVFGQKWIDWNCSITNNNIICTNVPKDDHLTLDFSFENTESGNIYVPQSQTETISSTSPTPITIDINLTKQLTQQANNVTFKGKVTDTTLPSDPTGVSVYACQGLGCEPDTNDTSAKIGETLADGTITFTAMPDNIFLPEWSCDSLAPFTEIICQVGQDTDLNLHFKFFKTDQYNQPILPLGVVNTEYPKITEETTISLDVSINQTCGNGELDHGELCDEGTLNGDNTSYCSADCTTLKPANTQPCPTFNIANATPWESSVFQTCSIWDGATIPGTCSNFQPSSLVDPLTWNHSLTTPFYYDNCYFQCDIGYGWGWDAGSSQYMCIEGSCDNGYFFDGINCDTECTSNDIGKKDCCMAYNNAAGATTTYYWDGSGSCKSEEDFKKQTCDEIDLLDPYELHWYENVNYKECKVKCMLNGSPNLPANGVWGEKECSCPYGTPISTSPSCICNYNWYPGGAPWVEMKFDSNKRPPSYDFYLPVSSTRHDCKWHCIDGWHKSIDGLSCVENDLCQIKESTHIIEENQIIWKWEIDEDESANPCNAPTKFRWQTGINSYSTVFDSLHDANKVYNSIESGTGSCKQTSKILVRCKDDGLSSCKTLETNTLKINESDCPCGNGDPTDAGEDCDAGLYNSAYPSNPYNGDNISGCTSDCKFDYKENTDISSVCDTLAPDIDPNSTVYEKTFQKQKCTAWEYTPEPVAPDTEPAYKSECSAWETNISWTHQDESTSLTDTCDYHCNKNESYYWNEANNKCEKSGVCGDGIVFNASKGCTVDCEECDNGTTFNKGGGYGCYGESDPSGNDPCTFEIQDVICDSSAQGIPAIKNGSYWNEIYDGINTETHTSKQKCAVITNNRCTTWESIIPANSQTQPSDNDDACYFKCENEDGSYTTDGAGNIICSQDTGGELGEYFNPPTDNVIERFKDDVPSFWSNVPSISRAGEELKDIEFRFKLPDDLLSPPSPNSNITFVRWKIIGRNPKGENEILTLYSTDCVFKGGTSVCEKDFANPIYYDSNNKPIIILPDPSLPAEERKIMGIRANGIEQSIINFLINPNGLPGPITQDDILMYPRIEFTFGNHATFKQILYQINFQFGQPLADIIDPDGMNLAVSVPDEKIHIIAEGTSARAKQSIEVEIEPTMLTPMFNYAVFQR